MATNVPGTSARLYRTQQMHYFQRGGPNDPVAQSSLVGGNWVSGSLSFNSVFTYPPVPSPLTPPGQPQPRVMSINSGGQLAVTTGILAQAAPNNGGILVGTIPGGSWIDDIEIYCYQALGGTGTTSTSAGLFFAPANLVSSPYVPTLPQPNNLSLLAYITTPAPGIVYSTRTRPGNAVTQAGGLGAALTGYQVGPGTPSTIAWGNGTTGWPQILASNGSPEGQGFAGLPQAQASGGNVPTPASGDIDVYFATFLIAGGGVLGTANVTGSFSFLISFTGQEG